MDGCVRLAREHLWHCPVARQGREFFDVDGV